MKFLLKNKGVITFYLIITVFTFLYINLIPKEQLNNENNSNLFVQK